MAYALWIVLFFHIFLLINGQTTTNAVITNQSWFWPLIGICLALLLSVPSTVIVLIFICYTKHKSANQSDESSESDETDSYSSLYGRRARHSASRSTERFHSPPPPYTSCEPPPLNLRHPAAQPPPYEPRTGIAIPTPPVLENLNRPTATTEVSSTLTNPSIQTFQV